MYNAVSAELLVMNDWLTEQYQCNQLQIIHMLHHDSLC